MDADLGIDRIYHVKIPVTDVAASARWYSRLLDMRLAMEFVEDDALRGVELPQPATGIRIALRDRAHSRGARPWMLPTQTERPSVSITPPDVRLLWECIAKQGLLHTRFTTSQSLRTYRPRNRDTDNRTSTPVCSTRYAQGGPKDDPRTGYVDRRIAACACVLSAWIRHR